MRTVTRFLAAGVIAAGLITVGATPASAATVWVEGGRWTYGVREGGTYGSGGQVYSFYQHNTRVHKATACNQIDCDYSEWMQPGVEAKAIKSPKTFGRNVAYYDVQ